MKIVYGEQLNSEKEQLITQIALSCNITFDTARLLYYRKQDSVEKVKRFLSPSKKHFHSPALLSGISDAIEKIKNAKQSAQNVLIFGDYDADGVCATTVLYNCLNDYGINSISTYIPERSEGYGLNVETIQRLKESNNVNLLITVDCGISDYDKIEKIKELGIDVIVTDHHEPPEILPDCIKINPKLCGQDYPFDGLCGAGVAYKLGYALIGEKANDYLDFVALATVADSMELIDENRDIVAEGLKLFNSANKLRLCMKYLLGENSRTVVAQTLAYAIAPRINAGGRMGDANCALKLFTSKDPNEIYDLAVKLNNYNIERQMWCDKIYREAKEKIHTYSLNKKKVILVKDENWQTGFVGIVAARLVEDYARPVIVFAGQDDFLKGSARSVEGINIHEAINNNKDLLLCFGGHSQAAGVSLSKQNFSAFESAINDYISQNYLGIDAVPSTCVEWEIEGEFPKQFAKEIELLEPFGVGNKSPLFVTQVNKVKANPLKENSPHYSFRTECLEMLNFNGEKDVATLNLPVPKKIVFEVNVSTFKGKEYVKGYVRGVKADFGDLSALKLNAINNQLDSILSEQGEYKVLDKNNLPPFEKVGTLYVISDVKNLSEYKQLSNLNISFARVENKNLTSEIVYAPTEIPQGYERVIYLDKPLSIQDNPAKTYVVKDLVGYDFIKKLDLDRAYFSQVFSHLVSLNNKPIFDLVDFALTNANGFDLENYLFALKVFIELGIFSVKNKVFTYNEKIKNALTNSKLYSKIVLLKDNYV